MSVPTKHRYNMTYFFPYGYTNPSAQTAIHTNLATTASFTASFSTAVNATFYAINVQNVGPSGSTGPASTSASCAASNPGTQPPRGPSGSIGPSGSVGPDLSGCPAGSVLCSDLTPPTGYKYVCIQTGSCSGVTVCPDTLP